MTTRAPAGPAELDPTTSDEQLLSRLLARDARAWGLFVKRHHGSLLAVIRGVLTRFASRYLVDAEEVECALMASLVANDMDKLRRFDPARGHTLGAWLALLARRAAWNHLRDCRRRSDLRDVLRYAPDSGHGADSVRIAIARQQCGRLRVLAERLKPHERRFFELYYIDEASVGEIADSLCVSLNTVYTKNYKLRSKLEPALDEPTARRRMDGNHARRPPPARELRP